MLPPPLTGHRLSKAVEAVTIVTAGGNSHTVSNILRYSLPQDALETLYVYMLHVVSLVDGILASYPNSVRPVLTTKSWYVAPDADNEPTIWYNTGAQGTPMAMIRRSDLHARIEDRDVIWATLTDTLPGPPVTKCDVCSSEIHADNASPDPTLCREDFNFAGSPFLPYPQP